MRTTHLIAVLFAALALIAAGCGGDSDSGEEMTAAEATAGGDGTEAAQGTVDTSTKPVVSSPGGEPPGAFLIEDIVAGKGREAKQGDTVKVQYVGIDYETGEEFDASWDRGEPFEFSLGGGEVIAGWDQGVEGMKVGGRRELVVPPDLAYGPSGQPPDIAPNATLMFVIDLLGVQPG